MMSVGENVAYGLRCRGVGKAEAARARRGDARARRPAGRRRTRRVDQLSGGQQQRVAIARCLVLEPTLLLLDEPLGALDLKLREHMKIELKQLQATFGTTFVYITHDQSEALVMSDRVAVMNAGRFEQVGTPRSSTITPRRASSPASSARTTSWTGEVLAPAFGSAAVRASERQRRRGRGHGRWRRGRPAFVRPEAIALATDPAGLPDLPNRFAGRVEAVLFDGANSSLLHRCAAISARRSAPPCRRRDRSPASRVGAAVVVGWTPEATRIFPA